MSVPSESEHLASFLRTMTSKVETPGQIGRYHPPLSELTNLTYAVYTHDGQPQDTRHPDKSDARFLVVPSALDPTPMYRQAAAALEKRAHEGTLGRESGILYRLLSRLLPHTTVAGFSRIEVARGVPEEVRTLLTWPRWEEIFSPDKRVAYLSQLTIHPLLPAQAKVAIHNRLLQHDLTFAMSKGCARIVNIMKPSVAAHVRETGMTATKIQGPTLNRMRSDVLFQTYPYYWLADEQPQLYTIGLSPSI